MLLASRARRAADYPTQAPRRVRAMLAVDVTLVGGDGGVLPPLLSLLVQALLSLHQASVCISHREICLA